MENILFVVSKILRPFLASPLFLLLVAATWAILYLSARSTPTLAVRRARRLGVATIVVLAVLSVPAVTYRLAEAWEFPLGSQAIEKTASVDQPFDAIVVLGGSVYAAATKDALAAVHARIAVDGTLEQGDRSQFLPLTLIQTGDAAERIIAGAALYRADQAPLVLVSGGSGDLSHPDAPEGQYMAALLQLMGVPASAIAVESESRNTYENATYSRILLAKRGGGKRVVLVTSAWHMRRSAAIFRRAGFDVVPYAVDSLVKPLSIPADIAPDAEALGYTTRVVREMIGYLAYKILGRL